ncbi:MAG: DUF4417 domain-containing protein [Clostridia bacterium]|nr:DUF4417 domain-containing protein [Clostridia bacterium]
MFLRNQFKGVGMFKLPLVKKQNINLDFVELIGYDKIGAEEGGEKIVHFFLDDNKFNSIYNKTDEKIDRLKKFKAVLTPDFSMYFEMPTALQLYNCFKNRWVGAYLQSKGIKVIPTVRWGGLESFNYCFDGIEKGCVVAVSTIGMKSDKSGFLIGYNEMLRRIKPEAVICYGKPFDDMNGNVIVVYYAETNIFSKNYYIKTIYGYVESISKGGGSSSGELSANPETVCQWKPKKESDKRFLGEPGELKYTFIETNMGGYWVDTKIGPDGRATMERQFSDHGNPRFHSNPHDHQISWDKKIGYPIWGDQINYFDGSIPELKSYISGGEKMKEHDEEYYKKLCEDYNGDFSSKEEFKDSIARGSEIVFKWKDSRYEIFRYSKATYFFGKQDNSDYDFYTFDELMKAKIGDDFLLDICTRFTVIERTF